MIYMENPDKKRYYLLFIEQDLFGTWRLVKSFGSLISRRGRTILHVCEDKKHASVELFEVESKKRQRGYLYADLLHADQFHLRPQTIKEIVDQQRLASSTVKTPKIVHGVTFNMNHPDQMCLFQDDHCE